MSELRAPAEILRLAIEREKEAASLYERIARDKGASGLAPLLRTLRDEEIEHRKRLEAMLPAAGSLFTARIPRIEDLRLTDAVPDIPAGDIATFQDLLLYAAKKEAGAVAFYESLAAGAADDGARRLFELLAAQERIHKKLVETEYENRVLPDN